VLNIQDPQAADLTATPSKPAAPVNRDGREDVAAKSSTRHTPDYIIGENLGSDNDFESVLSAMGTATSRGEDIEQDLDGHIDDTEKSADASLLLNIENPAAESQINLAFAFDSKTVQAQASDETSERLTKDELTKEGLLLQPHNAASANDIAETKPQTQISDKNQSAQTGSHNDVKNTDVQLQNFTGRADNSLIVNAVNIPNEALNLTGAVQIQRAAAGEAAAEKTAALERAVDNNSDVNTQLQNKQLESQMLEKTASQTTEIEGEFLKTSEPPAPALSAAVRNDAPQTLALTAPVQTSAPLNSAAPTLMAAPLQTPLGKPGFSTLAQTIVKTLETQKGVSVRLDPPEMGRVYIDYQFDRDNMVTALLRADTPEVLAQLRDNSSAFQDMLKQSGFENVSLSFEQNDSESQPQQNENYQDSLIEIEGPKNASITTIHNAAHISADRSHSGGTISIDIKL